MNEIDKLDQKGMDFFYSFKNEYVDLRSHFCIIIHIRLMMSYGLGKPPVEKKIVSRYRCNKCGWETIHTWHTTSPTNDRGIHVIIGQRDLICKKCGSRKTMCWQGMI